MFFRLVHCLEWCTTEICAGTTAVYLYLNDMSSHVNSPIFQFADDVKIFRTIGDAADFQQLHAVSRAAESEGLGGL